MTDKSPADRVQAMLRVVKAHDPIPTELLKEKLEDFSAGHLAATLLEQKPPLYEVSACVLIALIREVLDYRDRYGLIELPDEKWEIHG